MTYNPLRQKTTTAAKRDKQLFTNRQFQADATTKQNNNTHTHTHTHTHIYIYIYIYIYISDICNKNKIHLIKNVSINIP